MKKLFFIIGVSAIMLMINMNHKEAMAQTMTIPMKIYKVDKDVCTKADSLSKYASSFHKISTYHRLERGGAIIAAFENFASSIYTLKVYKNNKPRMTLYSIELDSNWYTLDPPEKQKLYKKFFRRTFASIKREKWGRNIP